MVEETLIDWFRKFDSCLVAFSGGLDSSVVAKAACLALGEKSLAVTAWSASSFQYEQEFAINIAKQIGIRFMLVESHEFDDPLYIQNDKQRCYHCKRIRFAEIIRLASEQGFAMVVDGSNADDAFDYRPGKRAVEELGVRSPLMELGIAKPQAREIAKKWNLSNWNKPASPCLSTRVAYGKPLSGGLLRRIEKAELLLESLGFSSIRVRIHDDNIVRIEVAPNQIPRLFEPPVRDAIAVVFRDIGFQFISVDLFGYQSGGMNITQQR